MLEIRIEGPVCIAVLSRPPQNAINADLVAALHQALDEADNAHASVIWLRSAAEHFCGGADPAQIAAWLDADSGQDALERDARDWAALFGRMASNPAVVLAEIRGNALGAGLGLALACDLRIASTNARLGVPEARVGLLPAGLTVQRLATVCGLATAQRLLLAGGVLKGAEAHALGLVHWVADAEVLAARAEEIAARVGKQSRAAVAEAKSLLRSSIDSDGVALDREIAALSRLIASQDSQRRLRELLQRVGGGVSA